MGIACERAVRQCGRETCKEGGDIHAERERVLHLREEKDTVETRLSEFELVMIA